MAQRIPSGNDPIIGDWGGSGLPLDSSVSDSPAPATTSSAQPASRRNAFLDPRTHQLNSYGFTESNQPGDLVVPVPDDFDVTRTFGPLGPGPAPAISNADLTRFLG